MKLYRTTNGIFVEQQDRFYPVPAMDWDELIRSTDLSGRIQAALGATPTGQLEVGSILAPVVSQEVWAAGVTYFRSRSARGDRGNRLPRTPQEQLLCRPFWHRC